MPIPAHLFEPETNTSYLVFCPEHGGWHVGEWWAIEGPGRWVLAYDTEVELHPSHVQAAPDDARDASDLVAGSGAYGPPKRSPSRASRISPQDGTKATSIHSASIGMSIAPSNWTPGCCSMIQPSRS
jgi:hypothetical protein